MAKGDSVAAEDGRLAARLAASLDPKLQDALDHPIRRELLRALDRPGHPRNIVEIGSELCPFRLSQIGYHLQVLRRAGTVVYLPASSGTGRSRARYASEVCEDGQVRAILRATERWDRERREAAKKANSSPLLTMFRTPRPVRTIRLRGGRRGEAEQGSE